MIACQSCQKLQAIAHGIWETHCIHCGSHTNLRDYAIDTEWHKRIQTRGNVHIKKHAVIRGVAIECHDLFCEGVLHGSVHCTGKLEFHNSSTIIGKIICQQLEIHPTCYIHSAAAIQAHSALILGQLRGSLHASGGVTLEKSAILHGNITAANIRIRPGARHVGSITIQNTPSLHTKNKTQK
jgi:cytoskeletal protein CcmA (bactofilin family)